MKKYRKIQEVLVWEWTGDKSIVDEINEVLKPYNGQGNGILKVGLNEKGVLFVQWKVNDTTSNEFIQLNDYFVFDLNNEFYPLRGYNKNWLDKNYVEL